MNWKQQIEAQIASLRAAYCTEDADAMQALLDVAVAAETASLCLSHELGCPEYCVKCDINHGIDKLREVSDE